MSVPCLYFLFKENVFQVFRRISASNQDFMSQKIDTINKTGLKLKPPAWVETSIGLHAIFTFQINERKNVWNVNKFIKNEC